MYVGWNSRTISVYIHSFVDNYIANSKKILYQRRESWRLILQCYACSLDPPLLAEPAWL